MLSGPIRPCLFEFMFLGSSGSLFLKIEKKGVATAVGGKRYLTLLMHISSTCIA